MRFAEDHVFNWQYLCHVRFIHTVDTTAYHKMSEDGHEYRLTFEEMDYVDGRLFRLKSALERVFSLRLRLRPETLAHLLFLDEPIRRYTASHLVAYYTKYHPDESPTCGYDFVARTVYYVGLTRMAGLTDEVGFRESVRTMARFIDRPWRLFCGTNIKTRVLIPFIKLKTYRILRFLLNKTIRQ